jgi:DNA-binding CsgD family transcriptional regulator
MEGNLPPRVLPVLERLLQGRSEKETATELRLSPHTVHQYVRMLYKHLGVRSNAELMAKWVRTRKRLPAATPTRGVKKQRVLAPPTVPVQGLLRAVGSKVEFPFPTESAVRTAAGAGHFGHKRRRTRWAQAVLPNQGSERDVSRSLRQTRPFQKGRTCP